MLLFGIVAAAVVVVRFAPVVEMALLTSQVEVALRNAGSGSDQDQKYPDRGGIKKCRMNVVATDVATFAGG